MSSELSLSLNSSISEEVTSISSDLLEIGLDSITDDSVIKEIPILSTAVNLYKIGSSLHERHYLKKLVAFICSFNKGIVDEEKRDYYKKRISDKGKQRDKELEYVLVLIDRFINTGKSEMLATMYLAYLDEKITWTTFTKCAETLDRLLPGDLEELQIGAWNNINDNNVSDSLLRLVSLGLVNSTSKNVTTGDSEEDVIFPSLNEKDYRLTSFGRIFLSSIVCNVVIEDESVL